MATVVWSKVPDAVLQLAHEIIVGHHPELLEFNIGFIFRSEASTLGGKAVLGQASKVSAKLATVLDMDGLIWLPEDVWYSSGQQGKRAMLDHCLCHFTVQLDGSLTTRAHDIEEFKEIIERYGLWNEDLRATANALSRAGEQLHLPILPQNHNGQLIALEPAEMAVQIE